MNECLPAQPVIEALAATIRQALGDDLVALYLYGSAATGGFDPDVSDIDLMAVTTSSLAEIDLTAIERAQRGFVGDHPEWSDRIEVVYLSRETIGSFRDGGALAVVSPGEPFHLTTGAELWIENWYLVRETGLTLFGPPVKDLVPSVGLDEFLLAIVSYADEVRHRDLAEASPASRAYGVLTMCRALRTVVTRVPCSKQDASTWARERFPTWAWLIDAALECRLSLGRVGLDDEPTRRAAEAFVDLLGDEIVQASAPLREAQLALAAGGGAGVVPNLVTSAGPGEAETHELAGLYEPDPG